MWAKIETQESPTGSQKTDLIDLSQVEGAKYEGGGHLKLWMRSGRFIDLVATGEKVVWVDVIWETLKRQAEKTT